MTATNGESVGPDVSGLAVGRTALVGNWTLDPDQSTVGFRSSSLWGILRIRGQFTALHGHGTLSSDGAIDGRLVIDVASVDTGTPKRDTHLASEDFFDAATYPSITFATSGRFDEGAATASLQGMLTISGQTHPLSVEVALSHRSEDVVVMTTALEIDRSIWGISWKKMGMTSMATAVEVILRFIRTG